MDVFIEFIKLKLKDILVGLKWFGISLFILSIVVLFAIFLGWALDIKIIRLGFGILYALFLILCVVMWIRENWKKAKKIVKNRNEEVL